ncbi:MAG: T9SS type A sorting domain-containing protein, partial [Bacteroidota bacterium]
SDGFFVQSVTGGVPPYCYTWSNGATTQDNSNLTAGTYNVLVTDTCGSSTSLNIQVTQPAQIALSVTTTNVSCPVNCFCTITATASPGAVITVNGAPYNPATQYPAGVYTVTATLPNSSGTGFCTRDTVVTILVVTPGVKYLVIDNFPNKGYYYDSNFNFIQSSPLITPSPPQGGVSALDVDFNGSFVFVLDGQGRRIFRSNQAGVAATPSRDMRTNTGTGLNPLTGLKVVGNQAFVIDKKSKAFYGFDLTQLYNGSTLNLNANLRIPLANGFAEAIAYDGTFYYILNNAPQAKTVFRFDPAGNFATIQSRPLLTETGVQLSDATGALVEGTIFWVTDRGFDKAYSYNLAALFAGTTGLNATAGRPLNIANISSHGITLVNSASFLRETNVTANTEKPLGLISFPNPNNGQFSLLLSGLEPEIECIVRITDLSGRLITERTIQPKSEQHSERLELDQTSVGTYLVNLSQGQRSQTVRVTVVE